MATTINFSGFLGYSDSDRGVIQFQAVMDSGSETQAGDAMISNIQAIGTTAEAFALSDVGTYGWGLFKNLSSTEDVQIGVDSGGFVPFALLKPGQWMLAPLAAAPWGKSLGVGNINVQYAVMER